MKSKKRVMLIYGGISSEREISIISSIGINESLIRNNYEVIKIIFVILYYTKFVFKSIKNNIYIIYYDVCV